MTRPIYEKQIYGGQNEMQSLDVHKAELNSMLERGWIIHVKVFGQISQSKKRCMFHFPLK